MKNHEFSFAKSGRWAANQLKNWGFGGEASENFLEIKSEGINFLLKHCPLYDKENYGRSGADPPTKFLEICKTFTYAKKIK